MISGMVISTVVTLLFTPVYYSVIDNLAHHRSRRKAAPRGCIFRSGAHRRRASCRRVSGRLVTKAQNKSKRLRPTGRRRFISFPGGGASKPQLQAVFGYGPPGHLDAPGAQKLGQLLVAEGVVGSSFCTSSSSLCLMAWREGPDSPTARLKKYRSGYVPGGTGDICLGQCGRWWRGGPPAGPPERRAAWV